MKFAGVVVTALLVAASSAGCAKSVIVTVADAEGVYDVDGSEIRVRFTTDQPIDQYINLQDSLTARGEVYICGQSETYRTSSEIRPADDGSYYFWLGPMNDRTAWKSGGLVVSGWPAALAQEAGVCMRIMKSEMLWLSLTSDEVVLPR